MIRGVDHVACPFEWKSVARSEEHTSELQSLRHLVCRLLLEKKKRRPRRPLGARRNRSAAPFQTEAARWPLKTQRSSPPCDARTRPLARHRLQDQPPPRVGPT